MSALSEFWRGRQQWWYRQRIPRAHQLRRHLAYYVIQHGFLIGDYSIGLPTIRFWNDGSRLIVGRYCSIAAGATFVLGGQHHTGRLTTFPLGAAFGSIQAEELPHSRGDIVVGSDVWIAANATVLSGVTVGDGAVIGAGAVVVDDVAPYAIVFGNPARPIRKRFPDHVVERLLQLKWWDLEPERVRALQPVLYGNDVEALIGRLCPEGAPPRAAPAAAMPARSAAAAAPADIREAAPLDGEIASVVRGELPQVSDHDVETPLADLGVDSFALLTLRARLEQEFAVTIDDAAWTSVVSAGDVIRSVARSTSTATPGAGRAAVERRVYALNMPQMALSGLSESWLFKELGDVHWNLITRGLGVPSSRLQDAEGNRLYATFTRFQLDATAPLAAYAENEPVTVTAELSRHGAGMFFSQAAIEGAGKSARARLMSSFSRYGEAGANITLVRGQPEIPRGCEIPALPELPELAREYRSWRARTLPPPVFECEYEISPSHDINGVGLLYFASYPIINDICAARYGGRTMATRFSTRFRDVFYFANSDPLETLVYRLHEWNADESRIAMTGSLSRKSDGVLMACIVTAKELVAR
jgi:probable biosynthetic protein (TIGR04098 family)